MIRQFGMLILHPVREKPFNSPATPVRSLYTSRTMALCKEGELIRKYFGELQSAMLHPQPVANRLWEKKIIDDATKQTLESYKDDQEKRTKLLESVIVTVKHQPRDKRTEKFETVLNVFKDYIPLDVVVDGIAQEYTSSLHGSPSAGKCFLHCARH